MEVCSSLIPQVPVEGVMWHIDMDVFLSSVPGTHGSQSLHDRVGSNAGRELSDCDEQ